MKKKTLFFVIIEVFTSVNLDLIVTIILFAFAIVFLFSYENE
jgi:hypothetical protein